MKSKKRDKPIDSKNLSLSLEELERSSAALRALGSPDRLRIIALLGAGSMNVQQIAKAAGLPMSTAAAHIRVLEDAGVLMSESVPGEHGAMKLCSRRLDYVTLKLVPEQRNFDSVITLQMPIGGYSRVIDIQPTCGLVNVNNAIGEYDNPHAFYLPGRFDAQMLWFRSGFVEYRFGLLAMQRLEYKHLELSFEACSEAPMYRNPWKSDISLYLNEVLVGTWLCPADLGGRKGMLNPDWWPDVMTQYGYLCTFRIDQTGSYLDNARLSTVTIQDLRLAEHDCITLRMGVDKDAEHVGGMNLFGERFGDFGQTLTLKVGYSIR
ncbi:MAG: ArsR/SmtB family transcription factor [Christensenellales bacterium]